MIGRDFRSDLHGFERKRIESPRATSSNRSFSATNLGTKTGAGRLFSGGTKPVNGATTFARGLDRD